MAKIINWKNIIKELTASGLTQGEIAKTVRVGQATISDLHCGKTKTPYYETGEAILTLYSTIKKPRDRRQKASV